MEILRKNISHYKIFYFLFFANEDEGKIQRAWKIESILCSTASLYGLFIIAW